MKRSMTFAQISVRVCMFLSFWTGQILSFVQNNSLLGSYMLEIVESELSETYTKGWK